MNVGEFFVTLGVQADTLKVKDFVRGIGEIPLKAAAGIVALAGVSLGIREVAEKAMDAAVSFGAFEAQTGLSYQELQRWQNVAMQANVSAEAVTSSVTALQRQMSEIRMGRGNISPFQILGIDPRGDAFKVIDQLRQKVKGMDRGTATNLISQMGLTPDMMQVLTLSDEKFKAFSRTITGMSPAQVEAFQKLRLELTKLKMQLYEIAFRVLGAVVPLITPLIHNILPALVRFIEHMVAATTSLVHWMQNIKGVLPAVGIAFTALAIVFAPVTAGVVALLLVLEDLYVWSKGGKSIIGAGIDALKTIFDDPLASGRAFLELLNDIVGTLTGTKLTDAIAIIAKNPGEDFKVFGKMIAQTFTNRDLFDTPVVPGLKPALAGARSGSVSQTNTFHIHSTAPAEDVGRQVAKHVDSKFTDAYAQMGNEDGSPR